MKKKMMATAMAALVALTALTGCTTDTGGTAQTEKKEDTTAAASSTAGSEAAADGTWTKDTPLKVGFSQNKLSVAYRVAGVEQLKKYVEEKGLNWEIIVTDGKNDANTQTANVEDLLSQGVDAMIMCPVTEDTMTTAAESVMAAGVPLVLVNRKVTNPDAWTCAITGSNYQIGQLQAEDMAARLGGKGKVALMEGTLGATDATDRAKGFLETIAKYPDIEVVADVAADFVKDKGMAVMEDILIKNPDLDGVACGNDEMAQGAYLACEAAGKEGVLIYGVDGYRSTLDMINEGKIIGTCLYPTSVQSAVDVLIEYFENGKKYDGPREIIDEVPIALPENADDFYDIALDA